MIAGMGSRGPHHSETRLSRIQDCSHGYLHTCCHLHQHLRYVTPRLLRGGNNCGKPGTTTIWQQEWVARCPGSDIFDCHWRGGLWGLLHICVSKREWWKKKHLSLKQFEQYYRLREHIPFECFHCSQQCQQPGESNDQCHNGTLKGMHFRPSPQICLVFGIQDCKTRENLLRELYLTLKRTDKICHAVESTTSKLNWWRLAKALVWVLCHGVLSKCALLLTTFQNATTVPGHMTPSGEIVYLAFGKTCSGGLHKCTGLWRIVQYINPPHMVDSTTFQPSPSPTNTRGIDSPVSEQELDGNFDHSLSDLNMATPRETTPADCHTSTPCITTENKATDDNSSSKSKSEEAPPKKKRKKLAIIDWAEKAK